jgi:hypothetical protein
MTHLREPLRLRRSSWRRLARFLLVPTLLLVAGGTARGQEEYGDVTITALPMLPVNAGTQPRLVTLDVPGQSVFETGWLRLTRETLVPPRGTVEVSLLQPPVPMYAAAAQVEIDGVRQDMPLTLESTGSFQQEDPGAFRILVAGSAQGEPIVVGRAPALPDDTGATTAVDLSGVPAVELDHAVRLAGEETLVTFVSPLPPAGWSSAWLAYSGYDAVVARSADLERTPAAVREALRRYVEAGGVLVAVGGGPAAALLGATEAPAADPTGWASHDLGVGTLLVVPEQVFADGESEPLARALRQTREQRLAKGDEALARQLAAVREAVVPLRALFGFTLLFAVVAGPVNLFVLARKRRKMWLLWTVPLLAVLACGALVAYAWFHEGIVRERSSRSFTWLDQETHRAVTWAATGWYASLTPSEGLLLSADTEVTPFLPSDVQMGGGLEVDWSRGQRLSSGWLVSRYPLHVATRQVALRRERLVVARRGSGLEVTNGLGAALERVVVADAAGALWEAADVAVGATASLMPRPGPAAGGSTASPRELLGFGLGDAGLRLRSEPQQFLVPGSYAAFLADDPFGELGLDGATSANASAVVWGRLARGEA